MHNIHELESRWFKYKLKSYLPYLITLVFSIILIITLIFILNSRETSIEKPIFDLDVKEETTQIITDIKDDSKEISKDTQTLKSKTIKQETIQKEIPVVTYPRQEFKQENKIILKPSYDFIKKLRTDSVNSYDIQTDVTYVENTTNNNMTNSVDTELNQTQEIVDEVQPVQKPKLNIMSQETESDVQDVIKRFKKNNNPALSLFIAKKYYKLQKYQQAYNYALITNGINNEIEQSWIIFAKSLVKMGEKNRAIRTLSKYIKHSGSGNAKVLLDDIKAGKFK